ncbi:MAG: TonB-dependent receptor plug domain-containing protein, partial [Pseudohongiella sp.]|nr:TonB-dependent receptor plug domain-containing protein [Pseudohongiella sp.]
MLGPLLSIALLSESSRLQAQEVADDSSTVVYPAAYFSQWSPVTAQDMMNRIPGVSSAGGGGGGFGGGGGPGGGGGGRGLGGGGGNQILIDGKRVAGKSNEANAQLARISADKVLRIELIRGTSTDLDVRGDQIINIVLSEALSSRSYSYEANTDLNDDGRLQPGGKMAVNGQYGGLTYLLSGEMEPRNNYQTSFESSVLGDFSANDTIREERTRDQYTYTTAANLGYEINLNSSVRLNLLYGNADNENEVFRDITNLRVTPKFVDREREDNPGRSSNWEVGGDYELRLANNHLFKALF